MFINYKLPTLNSLMVAVLYGITIIFGASPITVFTAEIGSSRRIIVSLGDAQPTGADWIHFSSDSATGRFSLTLKPMKNSLYQGRSRILERGVVPVQLTISNPDSESLWITGKTIPFKKVWSFWVVEENEFILDFFQEMPPETIFHEKSLSPGSPQTVASRKNDTAALVGYPKEEKHAASLFKQAVLYASLILAFGLALIFSLKRNPERKLKRDSNGHLHRTAAAGSLKPVSDKEAIREIMKSTGQTWDEAELSHSLSKDYGRV